MDEPTKIELEMTKAQIQELLGPPDDVGGTSRKYKEPCVWKYNGEDKNTYLQLTFWTHRYPDKTPATLIGVRVVDLIKDFPKEEDE
jgi:hypothetical protein